MESSLVELLTNLNDAWAATVIARAVEEVSVIREMEKRGGGGE